MYSVKSYYEITLMHLFKIVIFIHFVKIQCTFFYIATANDHEIIQKNKDQVRSPMISKRLFIFETKKYKLSRNYFLLQR